MVGDLGSLKFSGYLFQDLLGVGGGFPRESICVPKDRSCLPDATVVTFSVFGISPRDPVRVDTGRVDLDLNTVSLVGHLLAVYPVDGQQPRTAWWPIG